MVPAHVRCQRQAVADDDAEFRSAEPKSLLARSVTTCSPRWASRRAGRSGVEGQAVRQALDGEPHRPLARGRNRVQQGMAGMHAENHGAVDPRSRRGLWGEYDRRLAVGGLGFTSRGTAKTAEVIERIRTTRMGMSLCGKERKAGAKPLILTRSREIANRTLGEFGHVP